MIQKTGNKLIQEGFKRAKPRYGRGSESIGIRNSYYDCLLPEVLPRWRGAC